MTTTHEDRDVLLLELDVRRLRAEAGFLQELLCEVTGLDLSGVAHLVALHRVAEAYVDMEFDRDAILDAMGDHWWSTTVIARALLPNGGRGISSRERSEHHARIAALLRDLADEGEVESRRVADDGTLLDRAAAARGRTEWRRR